MLVNLIVADRIAPRYRSAAGPEDEIIERYRTYVAPYSGRLRVARRAVLRARHGRRRLGRVAQLGAVLATRSTSGMKDPQFGKDIGFYVFRLPFLEFAVGWAFAALLVVLIVTAVFHYLNGGIRLQSPWQRVTPQVKVHLSVILALMALTKTVQYYLARYELVFSRRGFVDGASYTDVKAQLPALNLLMIISIAAAVLFIANIFRKGWVFPIIAVGLWGVHLARRRHDLSRGHPALRRAAERVLARRAVHRAQHRRRRAPRSGSTKIVERRTSTTRTNLDAADVDAQRGDARATSGSGTPTPTRSRSYRAQQELLPVLPVHRRRRRPLHGRRRRAADD